MTWVDYDFERIDTQRRGAFLLTGGSLKISAGGYLPKIEEINMRIKC